MASLLKGYFWRSSAMDKLRYPLKNKNLDYVLDFHLFRKKNTDMHSHFWFYKCQVVRIGKRSPEWWWLKDKEGKSPGKLNKGRSKDQSEDLRQNKQHSWLAQLTQGRPRGMEKNIYKEEPKGWGSLSLSLPHALGCSSLRVFGSTCPHASKMDFLTIIQMKQSCNMEL